MGVEPTTPDIDELARLMAEALNRGDTAAAAEVYPPGVVWDLSLLGLGVHEGRDAVRAFLDEWTAAYEAFEVEVIELRGLPNGVLLGVYLQRGRPLGSTGVVDFRYANVATIDGGLITRVTFYGDFDEASGAAERLAEQRG